MLLFSVLYTYPGSFRLRELVVRAANPHAAKVQALLRLTYPRIEAVVQL